jgi:hypothetical protein
MVSLENLPDLFCLTFALIPEYHSLTACIAVFLTYCCSMAQYLWSQTRFHGILSTMVGEGVCELIQWQNKLGLLWLLPSSFDGQLIFQTSDVNCTYFRNRFWLQDSSKWEGEWFLKEDIGFSDAFKEIQCRYFVFKLPPPVLGLLFSGHNNFW